MEAGISGKFLSCLKGGKDLSRLKREGVIFLETHSRNGPHLPLRGESPGFSRVVAGNLGFLLSYDVDLRDPILLPQ